MVLQRGACHALAWLCEIRIFADRPGRMGPLSDQSVRRQHLWDQTGDLSNGGLLAHRLPSGQPHLSFRVDLSRIYAALISRLGRLAFESQGAFASQR